MTGSENILQSISAGVAVISFNRPEVLNAIDFRTAEAFISAVKTVVGNPDVRVIVIKGEGKAFVAGGDLLAFKNAGSHVAEVTREIIGPMHRAMEKLYSAPQIVIGSLHGPVAGAGMSLALACDLAIAAENTRFNMAYIGVANSPDCGGSWWLSRLVGVKKAMEITLLNKTIDATEALNLGLVNTIVPYEELEKATDELVNRLVNLAPLALASTKQLIRDAQLNSYPDHLDEEIGHFVKNAASHDFQEAVSAFFEKRKPTYRGS